MTETAARPPVGVGHMALTVADLAASRRFYAAFGLREVGKGDDLAVLELRGGTHLLLFQRGGPSSESGTESPFDRATPPAIDLMIEGRTFEALDAYDRRRRPPRPDRPEALLRPPPLQGQGPGRQRRHRLHQPRQQPAHLA